MPIPLRKSAGGFRSFGAINRGVLVGPGATGTLQTAGAGLTLGLNWRMVVRLKQLQSPGAYVFGVQSGPSDIWSMIYNFNAGKYELYSPANATGVEVRMPLNATVTDEGLHEIQYGYASSQLNGLLDGGASGAITVPNFAPTVVQNAVFYIAGRTGNAAFVGMIDYLLIEANGVALIEFDFNEADGPALNKGSLGGEMTFTDGGTREIVL
ncbi:hypothetical protein [Hymenobacter psychrotolerans]|uniref:Uncharacterized protein n=1 Tax=Hymenobacter psychrotolerans DSM 18569 TaxID=1121959 RepID=A0A1M6Z917_9BACT|nr:hypothetical protein [Hymenobacter psychrotolerans]SHL26883.1 hypothetical protein SAMN02746009_02459 [Hymenobacter psychrotolerans DSM 18569]